MKYQGIALSLLVFCLLAAGPVFGGRPTKNRRNPSTNRRSGQPRGSAAAIVLATPATEPSSSPYRASTLQESQDASVSPPPPPPADTPGSAPEPAPTAYVTIKAGAASAGACPDIAEVLAYNNEVRARHQAPPVGWAESLAVTAQAVAEALAGRGCPLEHSEIPDVGENLYSMRVWQEDPSDACMPAQEDWYNEVSDYKFDTSKPFTYNWINGKYDIGHFTQVVWKGTRDIGCGQAKGFWFGDPVNWHCRIVVCHYSPPGNVSDDLWFARNVSPPDS